jgi:hypothetical protein
MDLADWCQERVYKKSRDIVKNTPMAPLREKTDFSTVTPGNSGNSFKPGRALAEILDNTGFPIWI